MSQDWILHTINVLFLFGEDDVRNKKACNVTGTGCKNKAVKKTAPGFASGTEATSIFYNHKWCCWPNWFARMFQWVRLMEGTGCLWFRCKAQHELLLRMLSPDTVYEVWQRKQLRRNWLLWSAAHTEVSPAEVCLLDWIAKRYWQMVWSAGSFSQVFWECTLQKIKVWGIKNYF